MDDHEEPVAEKAKQLWTNPAELKAGTLVMVVIPIENGGYVGVKQLYRLKPHSGGKLILRPVKWRNSDG